MAQPITLANLPEDLARFAEAQVAGGRSARVEDVLEDMLEVGFQTVKRRQQRNEAKMAALRVAIAEGDASPDAEPGVFDRIRAKYGLPAAR